MDWVSNNDIALEGGACTCLCACMHACKIVPFVGGADDVINFWSNPGNRVPLLLYIISCYY